MNRAVFPNVVSGLNGFVGMLAIMYCLDGRYNTAILLVFIGVLIDGLDGMVARMIHTETRVGVYMDSIADIFTFCVAPAIILYGMYYDTTKGTSFESLDNLLVMTASSLIGMLGIYRLARFIDEINEEDTFKGLPTPASAMIILLVIIVVANLYIVVVITIIASIVMVSGVRYPKFNGKLRVIVGTIVIVEIVAYMLDLYLISLTVLLLLSLYVIVPILRRDK